MKLVPPKGKAGLAVSIFSACALVAGLTMQAEGWKNTPYRDTTGRWTVCNGETFNIDPHRNYSDSECFGMFMNSLVKHGTDVSQCLPLETPDGVRAALTDLAYNVGASAVCKSSSGGPSTIAQRAGIDDFAGACRAIDLYIYVDHRDCRDPANNCTGIVTRRAQERRQCEEALKK